MRARAGGQGREARPLRFLQQPQAVVGVCGLQGNGRATLAASKRPPGPDLGLAAPEDVGDGFLQLLQLRALRVASGSFLCTGPPIPAPDFLS